MLQLKTVVEYLSYGFFSQISKNRMPFKQEMAYESMCKFCRTFCTSSPVELQQL
jgi:hypothetical protein